MRLCPFGESPYAVVGTTRQATALLASERKYRYVSLSSVGESAAGWGCTLTAKAEITDPVQESVKR